jgi:outer membrane protein TolC
MQLNYPLMQEVILTDTLKEGTVKPISMVDAIQSALTNRNDIKKAEYDLEVAKIEFLSVSAYPRNSATYLDAKVTLEGKQMAYNNSFLSIEMEIRSKYMDLNDLKAEVASSKSAVKNAEEGVRIAKLSYNAGMNTLTDVKTAEKNYNLAQLGLAKAITDFNLAIYDFNLSIGKGTGNA